MSANPPPRAKRSFALGRICPIGPIGPTKMIKEITIDSQNYPCLLKEIEEPPDKIYVRGEIPKRDFLAIVGTRQCSAYGKQATIDIAKDLTRAGLGIISGMARGVDTIAHRACLEAGGKTIAVLATAIDDESIYPRENLKLSHEIIRQGGCLLSEFPTGTLTGRWSFPRRNRLISGLSIGVLVIEAKTKSGAIITARWAQKQNKKLFAIPGSIYSLNSWGPNHLIKKGAKLVRSAKDILEEVGISPIERQEKIINNSPEGALILRILKSGPLHIEDIIKQTGLSPQKVCSTLSLMEIEGQVRSLGGNIYGLRT